jgi:hypothetical protein
LQQLNHRSNKADKNESDPDQVKHRQRRRRVEGSPV